MLFKDINRAGPLSVVFSAHSPLRPTMDVLGVVGDSFLWPLLMDLLQLSLIFL